MYVFGSNTFFLVNTMQTLPSPEPYRALDFAHEKKITRYTLVHVRAFGLTSAIGGCILMFTQ